MPDNAETRHLKSRPAEGDNWSGNVVFTTEWGHAWTRHSFIVGHGKKALSALKKNRTDEPQFCAPYFWNFCFNIKDPKFNNCWSTEKRKNDVRGGKPDECPGQVQGMARARHCKMSAGEAVVTGKRGLWGSSFGGKLLQFDSRWGDRPNPLFVF